MIDDARLPRSWWALAVGWMPSQKMYWFGLAQTVPAPMVGPISRRWFVLVYPLPGASAMVLFRKPNTSRLMMLMPSPEASPGIAAASWELTSVERKVAPATAAGPAAMASGVRPMSGRFGTRKLVAPAPASDVIMATRFDTVLVTLPARTSLPPPHTTYRALASAIPPTPPRYAGDLLGQSWNTGSQGGTGNRAAPGEVLAPEQRRIDRTQSQVGGKGLDPHRAIADPAGRIRCARVRPPVASRHVTGVRETVAKDVHRAVRRCLDREQGDK